ncbi:hypothetical protein A2U01_0093125, partial [Trifolium medium]|nr:hypothetical protein [Trifolium medium]
KPTSKTKKPVPSTANTTPSAGKRSQRSDDVTTPTRSAADNGTKEKRRELWRNSKSSPRWRKRRRTTGGDAIP